MYLLTKNLKTKRPSKKLDYVKVGPFLVVEQRGPVSYRLDLPEDTKIYLVFYILLLEPAHPDTLLQKTLHVEPEEETEFEVEKIVL